MWHFCRFLWPFKSMIIDVKCDCPDGKGEASDKWPLALCQAWVFCPVSELISLPFNMDAPCIRSLGSPRALLQTLQPFRRGSLWGWFGHQGTPWFITELHPTNGLHLEIAHWPWMVLSVLLETAWVVLFPGFWGRRVPRFDSLCWVEVLCAGDHHGITRWVAAEHSVLLLHML